MNWTPATETPPNSGCFLVHVEKDAYNRAWCEAEYHPESKEWTPTCELNEVFFSMGYKVTQWMKIDPPTP